MRSFLSVDTFEDNQSIKMYPNPTQKGSVIISALNNDVMNAQVFDIVGKQVKNETLTENALNVSNFKSGIYIVKITQNNFFTTKKLGPK